MKNLKKQLTKNAFLLFLILTGASETSHAQNQIITLWNKIPDEIKAPDFKEKETIKDEKVQSTSQVTVPTLSVFLPKVPKYNQTAVIICPGGGYSHLAIDKEGNKVAKYFNDLGIAAFVLKYRLPNDLTMKNKANGPLQDAQEAVRYVRQNATKFGVDATKIGIMGFSAGGHLAATLSTHYDDKVYQSQYDVSAKPDFSILIYPVISMESSITHKGSQTNLLGATPSQSLLDSFSNEKKVTKDTPPAFLVHASDDKVVVPENSINYYLALKNNGVPAELHIYETGGHGFGLGIKATSNFWPKALEEWLKAHSL